MSFKEEIIVSKSRSDKQEALKKLYEAGGSQELYEAVLSSVPKSLSDVSDFVEEALGKLSKIDTSVPYDRPCHVVILLSHLVETGMVQSVQTNLYNINIEHDKSFLVSSKKQYCLAE
ncbi:hypothetical protein [Photobacterium damselae]|uniref:hypothetical protein n=1 Tax=Photobacterium damselae TaxID=38293 RepID=UPI001F38B290|nr:hypothetical protein [Photobacterium damselae]UKA04894.1 hypothetical protein IHC89_21865 [Photobacterium damselae subsp. damselae]